MAVQIPIITEFNGKGIRQAITEFKQLEKSSDKATFLMQKAAVPATAAFTAFAYAAKDAVMAASNFQESMSQVNVIFGSASTQIANFAKTSARSFGLSKQAVYDAAGTFGTFGKAAGLTGESLGEFATRFTALAADLASFKNTTPEDAIMAIGSALRGEYEPIRRYGVLLNEATLKAEALRLGIYKGSGALTDQQKILAAQSAIFKQTKDAQGDYTRTSDGLAGTIKELQARFEDLQVAMGQKFLPVAEDVLGVLKDTAQWAEANPTLMKKVGDSLGRSFDLAFGKIKIGLDAIKLALSLVTEESKKTFTGADKFRFDQWNGALSLLKVTTGGLTDEQKKLSKELKGRLADALKSAKDKVQAIKDEMASFAQGISSTISSFATLTSAFDKANQTEQAYQDALKERADAYAALDLAKQANDSKAYADALKRVADAESAVGKAQTERKNYSQVFAEQIAAAKSFAQNLTSLSLMGLGPAGIQQLLDLGPIAGAQVAKDLITGMGSLTIGGLNQSLAELSAAGTTLGNLVGGNVYGAELMSAQSDVKNLGRARVSNTSVVINVNGGDPDAVVAALRKYMASKGAVPIKVTNK